MCQTACVAWEYGGLGEPCSSGVFLERSRCGGGPVASQTVKRQSCKFTALVCARHGRSCKFTPVGTCQAWCSSWGSKGEMIIINTEGVFMQYSIRQTFGNLMVDNYRLAALVLCTESMGMLLGAFAW